MDGIDGINWPPSVYSALDSLIIVSGPHLSNSNFSLLKCMLFCLAQSKMRALSL